MTNEALGLLYTLQRVDADLKEVSQKTESSPEAAAMRDAKARDARVREILRGLEDATRKAQGRVRRLEAELAAVEEGLAKNERRLYGGEVTSTKELAALEDRVASDRRRKSELEEDALAAMEQLERRSAELEKARALAAASSKAVADAEKALEKARAEWNRQRGQILAERERLRSAVPADLLALYDSLSARLGGRVVAKVEERRCGGCHVELPTALRPGRLAAPSRCPNCSRILWWP